MEKEDEFNTIQKEEDEKTPKKDILSPLDQFSKKEPSKRYRSAFNLFISSAKKRYPNYNFGKNYLSEISKIWKNLDESEKRIYYEKSNQEKAEYFEYIKKNGKTQITKKNDINTVFPLYKLKKILEEDKKTYKKFKNETFIYLNQIVDQFTKNIVEDTVNIAKKNNSRKLKADLFVKLRKGDLKYRFLRDLTYVEVKKKVRVKDHVMRIEKVEKIKGQESIYKYFK